MPDPLKILLVDDDPWFQKIFEKRFQKRFPQHTLHLRQTPEAPEGYDAYVIDNDFRGASYLSDLAKTIRNRKPPAVVFGLSGTLDEAKRTHFRQAGCQDAFEKANPDEMERLFLAIDKCHPLSTKESQPLSFKVLLIDDDPDVHKLFKLQFKKRFPNLTLDSILEPEAREGYDVYVIDNDFHGGKLGGNLAQLIRQKSPEAVIIAHSATLDAKTLKSLLNLGCSGACEKGSASDQEELFKLIDQCALEKQKKTESKSKVMESPPVPTERPSSGGRGILAALRTAADLLREWNARLDQK